MRAATWNVHSWKGWDGKRDPERSLAVIRSMEAEVVALQEVCHPDAHCPQGSETYIAGATGYHAIAGHTLHGRTGPFGNILLSLHPLASIRRLDLSVPGRQPRGALDVTIRTPDGPVRVLATHLGLSATERLLQARYLLEFMNTGADVPLVLMGDLNEWRPGMGALRLLSGKLCPGKAARTFPSRFPMFSLDRFFVRPAPVSMNVEALLNPLAQRASDHLPVRAEIVW